MENRESKRGSRVPDEERRPRTQGTAPEGRRRNSPERPEMQRSGAGRSEARRSESGRPETRRSESGRPEMRRTQAGSRRPQRPIEGAPRRQTGGKPAGNRDPKRIKRRRQRELRRKILIFGGGLAAALLVILLIVTLGNRPPKQKQLNNIETVAEVAENAPNIADTGIVSQAAPAEAEPEPEVVSVPETPVPTPTPTPAPLVTKGYIDDSGYVNFVNDPAYSEKITILGTGDNIIHEALYIDAQTEDGGYDFTPMYARVKPYIQEADLATTNQETPLATAIGPASGYPGFNTPTEVGDALIDCGFDAINLATNHVYDKGEAGLFATIEYCQDRDLTYFGAFYDSDDRYNIRVKDVNGFKVALLGFVNYTNFEADNMGSQLIWFEDYDSVKSQITRAKEMADIVVVYVHWGEEYDNTITSEMEEASQLMVNWGADLIFGDHTHILQKITVLERESDGKLCPVQYCGGNFISGQKTRQSLLSALTTAEFAKNPETGDVVVTGLKALPIVTHYIGDRTDVSIYPLEDYTEELANANGVKQFEEGGEPMTLEYMWKFANREIPEQFLQHVSH